MIWWRVTIIRAFLRLVLPIIIVGAILGRLPREISDAFVMVWLDLRSEWADFRVYWSQPLKLRELTRSNDDEP